jgi:phage baseplate assembly protein W
MDDIPHLALPLRLVGSSFTTVQQDTLDELTTTVAVICAFPLGSRAERPEFGIADPALADEPLNTYRIAATVAAYEPRADVTVTERPHLAADPLAGRLRIEVAMARSSEEELSG